MQSSLPFWGNSISKLIIRQESAIHNNDMWRFILSTFMLIGFCIGTSVVTLPFGITLAGFWPSVIAIFLSWIYLLLTGLYFLEALLASPQGAHMYSITRRLTGVLSSWVCAVVFLAVNYGFLISYVYVSAPIFSELAAKAGYIVPEWLIYLTLISIFGLFVFIGLKTALFINFLIILGLIFLFDATFLLAPATMAVERIGKYQWSFLFVVFPSFLSNFYFHTLLPTLAPVLDYNRKKILASILVSLSVSALFYIAWMGLFITSTGDFEISKLSDFGRHTLNLASLSAVPYIGKWLPLILCGTIGIVLLNTGVIVIDFFSDIFRFPLSERKGFKRLWLTLLVFVPAFFVALLPLENFLSSIMFFTDIGGLYLTGLLPLWWIWSLRYFYHEKSTPFIPGGRPLLLFLTIISGFIFYLAGLEIIYETTF